jgi:hypothetical protein
VKPTPKPELHDIAPPSSVIERAVFEETPAAETSPIIENDAGLELPHEAVSQVRKPAPADSSRDLVLQRLGDLVGRAPGSVDFLLEFVSLLGGTDVLSGDVVDPAAVPALDPMFRLRLLATVKQMVASWAAGSPFPQPSASSAHQGAVWTTVVVVCSQPAVELLTCEWHCRSERNAKPTRTELHSATNYDTPAGFTKQTASPSAPNASGCDGKFGRSPATVRSGGRRKICGV